MTGRLLVDNLDRAPIITEDDFLEIIKNYNIEVASEDDWPKVLFEYGTYLTIDMDLKCKDGQTRPYHIYIESCRDDKFLFNIFATYKDETFYFNIDEDNISCADEIMNGEYNIINTEEFEDELEGDEDE